MKPFSKSIRQQRSRMKKIIVKTKDNFSIKATFFESVKEYDAVTLIVPGIGIRAGFYGSFARYLAENGIASYIFDYRGIGDSKPNDLKGFEATASQWAEYDIEGMLGYISKSHPDKKINILTHSGGGSILGLAPSAMKANKIIMVASPETLLENYEGISYLKMCLIVFVLYPFLSRVLGYFPSKTLRLGENLPKGIALEWGRWGRHPRGMEGCVGDKVKRFHAIESPMMTLSFDNDFFASKKCVGGLTKLYKNAKITHQHFTNKDVDFHLGHFCFFKKRNLHHFGPLALSFFRKNNIV